MVRYRPRPNTTAAFAPWALTWAAAIFLGMGLTGCTRSSTAERNAAAAAQIRAAQARSIAQQAGLGPDVQAFLAKAAGASRVTYTVVYDQGAGQSTTVMARTPNRRIDIVGGSGPGSTDRIVIRGTTTYVCHLAAKGWGCVSGVTSAPSGPFTPDAISATIASLAQLGQAYSFTVTAEKMIGLPASCLTASLQPGQAAEAGVGPRAVLCIAPSGVILRVQDNGSPVQATSYRPTVPSGAFNLPARPTPAVTTTSSTLPVPGPLPGP